jgi:hypothetical protein
MWIQGKGAEGSSNQVDRQGRGAGGPHTHPDFGVAAKPPFRTGLGRVFLHPRYMAFARVDRTSPCGDSSAILGERFRCEVSRAN